MANVAYGYEPGIDWVTEDALNDKKRLAFAQKVKVEPGNEDSNEITLCAGGKTYNDSVNWTDFPGSPNNRMTWDECIDKFVRLSKRTLGEGRARELGAWVLTTKMRFRCQYICQKADKP